MIFEVILLLLVLLYPNHTRIFISLHIIKNPLHSRATSLRIEELLNVIHRWQSPKVARPVSLKELRLKASSRREAASSSQACCPILLACSKTQHRSSNIFNLQTNRHQCLNQLSKWMVGWPDEGKLFKKIQLEDGQMAYILWRFAESDPSLRSEPQNFEYFAGEEAELQRSFWSSLVARPTQRSGLGVDWGLKTEVDNPRGWGGGVE